MPFTQPTESLKGVKTEKVALKDLHHAAQFIRIVRPKRPTVLIAKTNGILSSLVLAGQKVAKDTLIAKIENADIEKSYLLSKSAEQISRTQHERAKDLLESDLYKKSTVEEKKNIWISAQKALEVAKVELDKAWLYAPFEEF